MQTSLKRRVGVNAQAQTQLFAFCQRCFVCCYCLVFTPLAALLRTYRKWCSILGRQNPRLLSLAIIDAQCAHFLLCTISSGLLKQNYTFFLVSNQSCLKLYVYLLRCCKASQPYTVFNIFIFLKLQKSFI
jgi:hypothetical protein